MRSVFTRKRAGAVVLLSVGMGLLVLGTWKESTSVSILGLAIWVAVLLGLELLLLKRVNAARQRAAASGSEPSVEKGRTGTPVYAGMASIPSRVAMLERAVASIYAQVDHLFVYLNNYDEVPKFLQRDKISVFTSQRSGDIKDSGKFYGLTRVKTGIYLSLDDDIEYPPDYASVMTKRLAEFRNKCVIGVHGIFYPTLAHSFFDRKAMHFENAWGLTVPVSMLGTGTTAFSIEESGMRFDIFRHHGMADISLALYMKEHRIPAVVIRREAGWLHSLANEEAQTLYGDTKRDSTQQTAAIVAARPWGLPDLCERIEHAGVRNLLPVPKRWEAFIAAYRGEEGAADLVAQVPLVTLSGLIRTLMNDCEAWSIARMLRPKEARDLQLHCNLLRRCLSVYPEEVIALCREALSRHKEQNVQEAMMRYAGVYIAGLRKLAMYGEAEEFYDDLQKEQPPAAEVVMEYVRLKSQEGDVNTVTALALARYSELSQYADFIPIAYGALISVQGLQAALHAFVPSFFQEGRHGARRRRAIIAACKQAGGGTLGESFAFEFTAAEIAAAHWKNVRCILDLVLFYVVLGEKERARRLLDANEDLVEERCGKATRALMFAVTATDRRASLAYLNRYNGYCGLAPIEHSAPAGNDRNFFQSIETSGSVLSPMDRGKISVVMAAFNAAETIEYAVRSILAQSYRNLEVIIVDDASTDETWEVLEGLRRSDDRVNAVRNHVNVGPYVCRNIALSVADGNFIAIHDADDFAHPQRLERQIRAFDRWDALAVLARHIRFDGNGIIALENNGEVIGDGPVTLVCRRSVFEDIGEFLPVRTRGDIEFRDRMQLYYGSHRIVHLDDVLVYALHDPKSNSHAMVSSPEGRRKLELFRADYNRRMILMRDAEELKTERQSEGVIPNQRSYQRIH